MALLEVRGLAKVFALHGRTVNAIDNLTLDVEAGEFVSMVGPSGCGKSTFLHIVGGFEGTSGGSIVLAIPEPGSFALASVAGFFMIRRRANAARM